MARMLPATDQLFVIIPSLKSDTAHHTILSFALARLHFCQREPNEFEDLNAVVMPSRRASGSESVSGSHPNLSRHQAWKQQVASAREFKGCTLQAAHLTD